MLSGSILSQFSQNDSLNYGYFEQNSFGAILADVPQIEIKSIDVENILTDCLFYDCFQ